MLSQSLQNAFTFILSNDPCKLGNALNVHLHFTDDSKCAGFHRLIQLVIDGTWTQTQVLELQVLERLAAVGPHILQFM